ncbi:MAG: N-6 DNA methylase [Verrucomicrobiae bacterium]|nr:N-6 DNA methylase [Verrucomicrobiae bacterium]
MPAAITSDQPDMLAMACEMLGLVEGCLLRATPTPTPENSDHWTDKGDWLKLANSLDAESVFFVDNDPVLVLATLPEGAEEAEFFNRIWCMARPQILFLAREGELAVYKLAAPPVGKDEAARSDVRLLELARSVADISEKLADFRRESIESGNLFGEERFGTGYFRADRALVHDLKIVRRQLTSGEDRLSDEVAHSLIGRALFIRYLEDREVLVRDYFEGIASENDRWTKILNTPLGTFVEKQHGHLCFFRVLGNRDFTYAFFKRLVEDFNGDTFPITKAEEREVKVRHLVLLRNLLTGAVNDSGQDQLFLFAYRFDIIPIELISSIYEEFYTAKRGKGNTQSSYYTPPALADFLLARTLTPSLLDQKPRITDAACGSGIFLVEAFRRIVRHRTAKQGRRLSQRELRIILRDQIRGIDLNHDAVPVAAFSLYLAYLHYQNPREINETRRLPNLRWIPGREKRDPDQHLDILYAGNAFEAIDHEDPLVRKHFGPASADVVVGNPPWGEVKPGDALGRAAMPTTKAWLAADPARTIGDNELSQAFVHLALELLADGGKAALLLSSGVLFKQHENSRLFRQSWLSRCKLEHVVNFAHVRHIFFADPIRPGKRKGSLRESDGTSPFVSAIFEKGEPRQEHRFNYWSARRTAEIQNTRSVILAQTDMHRLSQADCRRHEDLWKLFWWGGRRDEGLIRDLERFDSLLKTCEALNIANLPGQGYTPGKMHHAPNWFSKYKDLPATKISRYGSSLTEHFQESPIFVHRPSCEKLYTGPRILIKRGIGGRSPRFIVSRFDEAPYLVSNSVNCFPLEKATEDQTAVILGIVWSSLAEYYFWLTANSWGMWHDEIQKHVACGLPIALSQDKTLLKRIGRIVKALQNTQPIPESDIGELDTAAKLQAEARMAKISRLEAELDEAIFDLYELNEADRDLVRDMCRYGLDFFYRRDKGIAVEPVSIPKPSRGLIKDLPVDRAEGMSGYLQVFLSQWNADLEPDGELAWEVIEGPIGSSVIAVVFFTIEKGAARSPVEKFCPHGWSDVLTRISKRSLVPAGSSQSIYTDTFVRAVSEHEILIIKRNEARHWTRSMAREDADATVARAMQLADQKS